MQMSEADVAKLWWKSMAVACGLAVAGIIALAVVLLVGGAPEGEPLDRPTFP